MDGTRLFTKNYIILLFSNFLTGISYTSFVAVFPIYVADMGGDNTLAGTMAGAMILGMMLSRPFWGVTMDKIGRRPVILAGGVLFALNTVLYIFVGSLTALFITRVTYGLFTCMYTASTSTMVADIVPERRLVEGLGYYSISSSLNGALGPMLGVFLVGRFGFPALLAVMSIFAVVGVVITFFMDNVPYTPGGTPAGEGTKKRRAFPVELAVLAPAVVSAFMYMGASGPSNFLPSYGLARGMGDVSVFFAANGLLLIILRLTAGRISGKIGESASVLLGIAATGIGYVVIAFAPSLPFIALAGMLAGGGTGLAAPIINAMVYRLAPPERKGTANATFGLLNDIGNGTGSALWGGVSQHAGYFAMFIGTGLCAACAAAVHIWRLGPKIKRLSK
ncbi:MFS transporter [Oscillospiraceae bacterium OttesenSCG-928-F05]|nr:MFS transporter [Oscillospiraceae bacterium OttesenSCG-928-F05]